MLDSIELTSPISNWLGSRESKPENIPEKYADWLVDLDRYYGEGHAGAVTNGVRTITGRDPIRFEQHARDYADLLQKAA